MHKSLAPLKDLLVKTHNPQWGDNSRVTRYAAKLRARKGKGIVAL